MIAVDLPGHGGSPDPGRPLRAESLADDVAELITEPVDVMGYSLGGMTALRLAIQHPDRVRRLVLVSVAARRSGNHPEVIAAMEAMAPEFAEPMKQSPNYALYTRLAPTDDWALLVARTAEFLKVDYDWTAEVASIKAPTLLVYADQDSITPAHIVEFYGRLGGGLKRRELGLLRARGQPARDPAGDHALRHLPVPGARAGGPAVPTRRGAVTGASPRRPAPAGPPRRRSPTRPR